MLRTSPISCADGLMYSRATVNPAGETTIDQRSIYGHRSCRVSSALMGHHILKRCGCKQLHDDGTMGVSNYGGVAGMVMGSGRTRGLVTYILLAPFSSLIHQQH